jgi:hypothetical protein
MRLPKFVVECLLLKYDSSEVELIDSNWLFYASSSISFDSSSLLDILCECDIVLECALYNLDVVV